jgi:hypothetical protein
LNVVIIFRFVEEPGGLRRQSDIVSGKIAATGDGSKDGEDDSEKEDSGRLGKVHD